MSDKKSKKEEKNNAENKEEMSEEKAFLRGNDAKKLKNFDLSISYKGFISSSIVNDETHIEVFLFEQISEVVHYPNKGVEIILLNSRRKMFYNDEDGASQKAFDFILSQIQEWMKKD